MSGRKVYGGVNDTYFRGFRDGTVNDAVRVLVQVLREKFGDQPSCRRGQLRRFQHGHIPRSYGCGLSWD